jgi:hypothetical protein
MLGYTAATLKTSQAQQVQGVAEVYEATESSIACLPGAAALTTFSICPVFVPGALNALWGRRDFLNAFPVAFYEAHKKFVITISSN